MSRIAALFGHPTATYTRAQALTDGVLHDVTDTAREGGFAVPVALTAAAWADAVAWDQGGGIHDESARLGDVLFMAAMAARRHRVPGHNHRAVFYVFRVPNEPGVHDAAETPLCVQIGPGDNGEPVVTITTPRED